MSDHSEAFVAFDTSKLRHAVAIAEAGRSGEVRFLGEIDTTEAATVKLVKKLAGKYARLTFCYEGRSHRQGNSRLRCVADHSIDARAKTGTAPDEHSELRLKSAHQSLITDVSRLRPYRCTINHLKKIQPQRHGANGARPIHLTKDIRAYCADAGALADYASPIRLAGKGLRFASFRLRANLVRKIDLLIQTGFFRQTSNTQDLRLPATHTPSMSNFEGRTG